MRSQSGKNDNTDGDQQVMIITPRRLEDKFEDVTEKPLEAKGTGVLEIESKLADGERNEVKIRIEQG
jgi:hypothetical protein